MAFNAGLIEETAVALETQANELRSIGESLLTLENSQRNFNSINTGLNKVTQAIKYAAKRIAIANGEGKSPTSSSRLSRDDRKAATLIKKADEAEARALVARETLKSQGKNPDDLLKKMLEGTKSE